MNSVAMANVSCSCLL